MIFKNLELVNFGIYKGNHSIELAPEKGLVGLEAVLALDETNAVVRREPVARVGRRAAMTTARAVTVVGHLERLGDMVFDGAAQAAAANHASRRLGEGLVIDGRVSGLFRIGVVARQVAGHPVPGRAVDHEDVAVGGFAVVVCKLFVLPLPKNNTSPEVNL